MKKGILETLREDVKEGELIALIERDEKGEANAHVVVFGGVTENYSDEQKTNYPSSIKVRKGKEQLIVLSKETLIFNPSQSKIGRIGLNKPEIFELPKRGTLSGINPQEIYVGEYAIKQAFEQIPELAVYARLIDSYPK